MKRKTPLQKPLSPKTSLSGIQSVVQAYIEICATEGLDKVTLKTLSEKTGLAQSNVKYHIDLSPLGLDLLCQETIRDHINLYLEENLYTDRKSKSFDPLKSYAHNMLQWSLDYPNLATCLLMVYYRSALNHKRSPTHGYDKIIDKALTRLESLYNEALGMGLYTSPAKDKHAFITCFHAIVLGNLIISTNMKSPQDLKSRLIMINDFLDLHLQQKRT